MRLLVLLWPACGIVVHILKAIKMETWFGTPIWHEPMTYVMFIPAMIVGPILLLL
jgi:hypothetical protein